MEENNLGQGGRTNLRQRFCRNDAAAEETGTFGIEPNGREEGAKSFLSLYIQRRILGEDVEGVAAIGGRGS